MVSLEQPRALAAGAINPLDSMSASAICCGVYLRYGARGPALTSSAMLSFLSFFEVAKVSNVLISSDCSTPSVRAKLTRASWRRVMSLSSSASTASPGATGLPRLRFRGAPIGLSSINYCLLRQTNVCICIMHRFGEGFIFSSVVTLAREDQGSELGSLLRIPRLYGLACVRHAASPLVAVR